MKIAIIGCGYVGRTIAKRWKAVGHELTVTTTSSEKVSQLADLAHRVKVIEGSDQDALRELCEGQEVILLSVGSKGGRTEENYRRSYLQTAQNLRDALRTNSTVKQVIYTSSYSVVGNHDGAWVDESTPDQPANIFAEILREVEQTLMEIQTGDRHVCILRLGGIYGEGREILKIFRRAMGTTKAGKGAEYGNWIHLADIVRGIEFAREKQLSGLFNLVADEPMQRREMLDRLAKKYNLDPVLWDEAKPSDRIFNVRVSNQKLRDQGFLLAYPTIQL
ncbi:NADP oxidoreductase coenzyme F420-dependent [[Leptolyngbya] sp. PCC 7376]|uniref:SDR family oxidoreductase n=1 Tax=[Leptolyngbya] sp. PCC 7376 TaxID=111781 RepID=UPI00029F26E6|nr:SDR family oxidoreductase [[Leptolyngbya] sp. PCC 7376]AFY40199.1 NADP oxidoreductase coenzyme F420-dependent [[Leptolyngbya] sp. PCC 7376]